MNHQALEHYIARMPSFSTTVTKVLAICNQSATSPNDLKRVISLDPVLTGRVLKLVNSAYYSQGREVTSLTRAIMLLGLNTVKNLVLSTAVLECMGGKDCTNNLFIDDFWVHSLGVGVIARSVSVAMGIPMTDREEFFVAGLLHDLGKIPLYRCYPEVYGRVLESAREERENISDAETKHLGIHHGTVGGMIAQKWRLNQSIDESLRYHHHVKKVFDGNRTLTIVIALANSYINRLGIGFSGYPVPEDEGINSLLGEIAL
jgi:putative nucleotidyltransferase with HDIG domain